MTVNYKTDKHPCLSNLKPLFSPEINHFFKKMKPLVGKQLDSNLKRGHIAYTIYSLDGELSESPSLTIYRDIRYDTLL